MLTKLNKKFTILFLVHLLFIVTFVLIYESGIFYASGDYYNFTKILSGDSSEVLRTQTTSLRTFGYPVFLLLSGVLSGNQYSSVLTTQTVINLFIIPLSIFFLYRRNKFYALTISVGLLITFQPYLFVRSLLSEYLFAVSIVLLIIETLKIKSLSIKSLALPTALAIIATSARSTGIIILPLFILTYTLLNFNQLKKGIISLIAVSVLLLSSTQITKLIIPNHSSGFGIMSFMNLIMSSSKFDHIMRVKTPASKQVFSTLQNTFSGEFEKYSKVLSKKDKRKYLLESTPDTILKYGFRRPTLELYWQSKWSMLRRFGPKKADKVLTRFFFDNLKKRPKPILKQIVYNAARYVLMDPFEYSNHSSDTNKISQKIKDKKFRVWASRNSISQLQGKYKNLYGTNQTSFFLIGNVISHDHWFSKDFKKYFVRVLNFNLKTLAVIGLISFFINFLFFITKRKDFKNFNISLFALLVIFGHAVIVGIAHPPISRYLSPIAFLYILIIGNLLQNKVLIYKDFKKLMRKNV